MGVCRALQRAGFTTADAANEIARLILTSLKAGAALEPHGLRNVGGESAVPRRRPFCPPTKGGPRRRTHARDRHLRPQIRPATTASPPRVSVVVAGAPLDEQGVMHVSPECVTLDELEGQLNGLQDELDVLRAEARRAFAQTAGHA